MRFQLLGGLKIFQLENSQVTPIRTGGSLITYLILQDSNRTERKKCANDLYPDEPYEVSGNRIRVSLARYKKIFGQRLVVDGTDLQLLLSGIQTDYYETLELLAKMHDQIEASDELEIVRLASENLVLPLLPELNESWITPYREDWDRRRFSALARLTFLESEAGNYQLAIRALNVLFSLGQMSEELWITYFRCHQALGILSEAESSFNEALTKSNGLSDKSIKDLREHLKQLLQADPKLEVRWTDTELLRLGRLFARTIEDDPNGAAQFFSTQVSMGEFHRDPQGYLPFLYSLISNPLTSELNVQDTRLRISEAVGLKYDWNEVILQTDILLNQELDDNRLARTYFIRSFAKFQQRNYDEALTLIKKSEEIIVRMGDRVKAMNSRTVQGSFLWHMGEYQQGLEIYEVARNSLADQTSLIDRANLAINWANTATVYVILDEYEKAFEAVVNSQNAFSNIQNENMLAMANTLFGLVYYRMDQKEHGTELMIDGLKRSYRRGSSREMQIGLEWAAGLLFHAGDTQTCRALLEWVECWRIKDGHVRSVAESTYANRLLADCGSNDIEKLDPLEAPDRVIRYSIQQIRQTAQLN